MEHLNTYSHHVSSYWPPRNKGHRAPHTRYHHPSSSKAHTDPTGTPNGFKASILLEELKEAYGLHYTWQSIDISKNYQKEPWFIAVNPNGRIPAIVDHDHNDFPVFEGNAILGYLTRKYDTERRFSFPVESDDYTTAEAWIGWQHGGVGPM